MVRQVNRCGVGLTWPAPIVSTLVHMTDAADPHPATQQSGPADLSTSRMELHTRRQRLEVVISLGPSPSLAAARPLQRPLQRPRRSPAPPQPRRGAAKRRLA